MQKTLGWILAGWCLLWSVAELRHVGDPGISPYQQGQVVGNATFPALLGVFGLYLTGMFRKR